MGYLVVCLLEHYVYSVYLDFYWLDGNIVTSIIKPGWLYSLTYLNGCYPDFCIKNLVGRLEKTLMFENVKEKVCSWVCS